MRRLERRHNRLIPPRRPLYAALIAIGLGSAVTPAFAQVCSVADTTACSPAGGTTSGDRAGAGGAGNGQGGGAVDISVVPFTPLPALPSVNGAGSDGAADPMTGTPGTGGAPNVANMLAGGRGQDGGDDPQAPGGGGGGGTGVYLDSGVTAASVTSAANITGGDGGNGGAPTAAATGGAGGGGGGAGVVSARTNSFVFNVAVGAAITGGKGGTGGQALAPLATWGGGGGGGGDGLLLLGTSTTVNNDGTIKGGAGGLGGSGINGAGGDGASGAGLRAIGDGLALTNTGSVIGADGAGSGAAGAAVVTAGHAVITNTGLLQGGQDANGRAAAVLFNGAGNDLRLGLGSQVQGEVEIGAGAAATITANVDSIVNGAQLDGGGATLQLLPFAANDTLDMGAEITGTGNVTSTGPGTVVLRGVDLTGTLDLANSGGVQVGGATHTSGLQHYAVPVQLIGTTNMTSDTGAITFDQGIDGAQALTIQTPAALTVTGPIGSNALLQSLNADAGTLSLGPDLSTGSLTLRSRSGDIEQTGVINVTSGPTSLIADAGSVSFGNLANSFAGGVQVQARNLAMQSSQDLTFSSLNVSQDITLKSVNVLTLPAGGVSASGTIDLTAAQIDTGSLSANAISLNSAQGMNVAHDITAAAGLAFVSSAGSFTQTAGTITADRLGATLTAGDLNLSSAANSFNHIDNLSARNVALSDSVALSIDGQLNMSSLTLNDAQGVTVTGSINQVGVPTPTNGVQIGAGMSLAIGNGGTTGSLNAQTTVDGTLAFDRSDTSAFGSPLLGSGQLVQRGTGTLIFNGDASAFTGTTDVQAGRLVIGATAGSSAVLGGDVAVASGATLAGHGRIGGNATLGGGATLSPGNSIGTLTVDGDLSMANGTRMAVELGTPGTSDNVAVGGDLRLDGVTVDVANDGGLAPGVYNIFSYGGDLLNDTIALGATPAGHTLQLQILTNSKRINILDAGTLQFWNANGLADATRMGGGDGTWSTTAPAWANADGSFTGAMAPQPGFAVFGGAPGLVTVDNAGVRATGLQFLSDGYRIAGGPIDLATSGDPVYIRVGDSSPASAGYTATIDSVLTGTQGFTKMDAGTLVLNGANTYTGTTSIAGGTLAVGHDANLGVAGNAIVLDGGALRVTGAAYTATNRGLSLQAGGAVDIADASNVFTWQSAITGTGALEKSGAGTLVLAGANTYGGGTVVSGGTLQVGDGATSGSFVGAVNIGANTALAFNRSDTVLFSDAISGAGAVQKLGAGTLVLTGANTYSGGTTINAGALAGNTGSLQGNIANKAALVFDQAADGTYAGMLSGNGSLTKQGAGTLVMSGDSSAFAGVAQIGGGTLQVNGSLGGQLTALAGSTLGGTGTVGSTLIASNATLSPGSATAPVGTLNVKGNLTFAPGSAYKVDTSIGGGHDSVHATGTANLAGSVVDVGENGNYSASGSYTILTADSGLQGTFNDVSSNLAFLTPSLVYGADSVDLLLQLKNGGDTRFADAAQTRNQRATANGLQSLPAGSALYTRVLNLPDGAPPAVFDSLSGAIHPSTTSVLRGVTDNVASLPLAHLRDNLDAGLLAGAPTAQLGSGDASTVPRSAAQPVWAQVFGNWRTLGGNGDTAKVQDTDTGLYVGGDRGVGHGWRVGGALGYTNSDIAVHDQASHSDADSYSAAIFGGKAFEAGPGKINLSLGAAYTWHDISTKRNANAAGQDESLKAAYHASTAQVFTELGYALPIDDRVTLEPFVGGNFSELRTRAFSESGGDAALSGDSNSNRIAATTLGLHARANFESAGAQGTLQGTLGWRHAFGDITSRTTMAFEGGQSFSVVGAPIAQDSAVLQLGVSMSVSRHTTVGVAYIGQFGDHSQQHAGTLDVRYSF